MRGFEVAILAIAASIAASPTTAAALNRGYAYYEIGNVRAPRPAPTQSALLLNGGGEWNLDAFRWFAAKTGHGHLVVIAAYGEAEDGQYFYRDVGGFTSVETFVFSSRKASYDPRVLRVLRHADGIFIAGGDQSKYVRFWKGTPVAHAIDAEIASGRPVGGTSAGLAVLGAYAYGAMDGGSIDAPTALANPLGPAVTMVRDFLHMPFLDHVVTDTHFSAAIGRAPHRLPCESPRTAGSEGGRTRHRSGQRLCVDSHGIGRFFTSNKAKPGCCSPPACRASQWGNRSTGRRSGLRASGLPEPSTSRPCT